MVDARAIYAELFKLASASAEVQEAAKTARLLLTETGDLAEASILAGVDNPPPNSEAT